MNPSVARRSQYAIDSKGNSIKTIAAGISSSGGSVGLSQLNGSTLTVPIVQGSIPLDHIPFGTKSATFKGTIAWGTAPPIPIQVEVLPTWMRRKSARLSLRSVEWQPSPGNPGRKVEVVCNLAKPNKPIVYGVDSGMIRTAFGIGYDPQDQSLPSNSDIILAEWSERVESGDERVNSLDLLRAHINKQVSKVPVGANGGFSYSPSSFLFSFDPICTGPIVEVNGDEIHLSYLVSPIPPIYKNPVFRCEIYLVGDGFLAVKCPVTFKAPRASR